MNNVEDIYPLSPMQQGMLFHSLLAPDSGVYVEQYSCTLHGELDVAAFAQAWQQVADRHPILRTAFVWEELDEPLQVVHQQVDIPLQRLDWRDRTADQQQADLDALLAEQRTEGFDLTQAPLMRNALIRLSDDGTVPVYIFVWCHHHLLIDGWCQPQLLQEVMTLYEALRQGQKARLPRRRPYRDYIAWLQEQDMERAEAFWKRSLAGVSAPTPLVVPRPTVQEPSLDRKVDDYQTVRVQLSEDTSDQLQSLAREHQLTLNTLVQGAWALLLHRYSCTSHGEQDVVFGATVSGRPPELAGADSMMGVFINTLPVRVTIAPQMGLLDWLHRLQTQQAELREFEFTPLLQIQGWSDVPRDLPLFESILIFENFPVGDALRKHEGGMSVQDVRSFAKTNYPFTVVAFPGSELTLRILFDATRYDPNAVKRMLGHLQTLLESMSTQSTATNSLPIGSLPMLSEDEVRQLAIWNETATPYPVELCAHQRFEEIAEQYFDTVAVLFDTDSHFDDELTYRELNKRANQLAHFLRQQGVGPESIVGICLPRSNELIVSLLAILKAGGAFLPLDPNYPQERLAYMLDDSGTQIVVTNAAVSTQLNMDGIQLICLDSTADKIGAQSHANPITLTVPESLAYVIYTSGSTGQPKGTLLQHTGMCSLAVTQKAVFGITSADRILQFFSFSFDGAVWEIVMALLNGATLVMARQEQMVGQPLVDLLRRRRITTITLAPSVLAVAPVEDLPDLHNVITAGEAVWQDLVNRWGHGLQSQNGRFFNAYGPTETTVCASLYRCAVGEESDPPLGFPIANFQLHVLDANFQPVPVGVAGELFLAGVGLARAYHNRPDLTATQFVPNPFSDQLGARMYRTGDLARYRADGNVEFLGRIDHQVKMRGFRIELGEIEATLTSHPAIQDALVMVREEHQKENGPAGQHLVAYLVAEAPLVKLKKPIAPEPKPAPNRTKSTTTPQQSLPYGRTDQDELLADLRAMLSEQLPAHMVPSIFVLLEAMPLNAAGKIDRNQLPAPDWGAQQANSFVAPRTPTEELLSGLWADVLGQERVGITDNFFNLGGHSLLATQLVSRVRDAFQIELPLRTLFELPTVAAQAAFVDDSMRAGQRSLTSSSDQRSTIPSLRPTDHDGQLPLSFAQQRLWFLDKLAPQSAFYNIPTAIRLRGLLDIEALTASLQEIVRRHEAMRTTFAEVDGVAVQVIAPEMTLELPVTDLSAVGVGTSDTDTREDEARRLATETAQQPFDLQNGPLFRAALLQLDQANHVLLFTMHHIISDGWSMGVLIREFGVLYQAFRSGNPSPLSEPAIQYGDFAIWQRGWLQGDVLDNQLDYWTNQLADCATILELPTDRPRPNVQSFSGADYSLVLPTDLTVSLRALSRQHGTTLFMTLLAGFQSLLHRYSGQRDILVGSPIANRTQAETESMIGFFVNTLVMRTRFSGDPTFADLLQQVRETALGAYAHQDLPFEQIVDVVQPERDMGYSPLFQVVFSLQSRSVEQQDADAINLTDLHVEPLMVSSGTARYDMTLVMTEAGDALAATLEYNTDLFDAATIERFMQHFINLLQDACADAEQRVSQLTLLSQTERHQLLTAWTNTATVYPRESCIHELFAEQANRTPDRTAVVFKDQQLTYRELNERANQLAHYLQSIGVGPEAPVGLCLDRSLEMIIGTLAILKAGGAYLPIDPAYPAERISFMLADAQPHSILCHKRTYPFLESAFQENDNQKSRIVNLDDWHLIAHPKSVNPLTDATGITTAATNLAYIMYTSGSTGQPKGTRIEHRSVIRLVKETNFARLDEHETWLQFAPISFDAATLEIWGSLLNGGKLVVFPPHTPSLPELGELIRTEGITSLWLTSGLFHLMVDERLDDLAGLRQLLAGGDVLSVPHVRKALMEMPTCTLINGYGPTENTTFTCCYPMTDVSQVGATISIGQPIANTQVYILDQQMQPVPIGVVGELYIGGDGLTRDYQNRPALTADKLVPHPFSHEAGARLYRTGDLARWLADGNIEFLGRGDSQVKLRGFRIELGEIETALIHHPALREAVVLAKHDEQGTKRLVAYVVASQQPAPSAGELRYFLQERLPDYMVPSAFILLETLPLNPNGKVDRNALLLLDQVYSDQKGRYVAPRTRQEELLVQVFHQVLPVKQIGIYDSFFELGGDSIGSIQLISRAAQVGIHLTVAEIFQHPTVAGLAALPGVKKEIVAEQDLVEGSAPLTPIQQWFFSQEYPTPHHWNWAFLFQLEQPMNTDLLAQTLHHITTHHDALRMRFGQAVSEDGHERWQQVNAPEDASPPMDVVDLSAVAVEQLSSTIETQTAEIQKTLDLTHGPLLRMVYYKCGSQPDRLLFVFHHLVVDGVSARILLEDFQTIYGQLLEGRRVEVLAKTTSYRTWAQRLFEYAQSAEMRQELAYWQSLLTDYNAARIPLDYPDGINSEGSSDRVVVTLSAEETETLLQQLPLRYGTQINDVLLTALARTLVDWSRADQICIETEGHGREPLFNDVDISRTVGWFSSMYTILLDLRGTHTAVEALQSVQQQLCALPQRGIGFGLLRHLCQDKSVRQQMASLPQAEVNFNYLGQFEAVYDGAEQGTAVHENATAGSTTLFRPATERTGPVRNLDGMRTVPLYVLGSVSGGKLSLQWSFSRNLHKRETVERIAGNYVAELRTLMGSAAVGGEQDERLAADSL